MKHLPLLLLVLLALPLTPGEAAAQERIEITETRVPWENSRPRDPYVGPDGTVWFVGQRSHYVASLDPATGTFERYDLEDGTGPHNLVVDAGGTIWYAGNRAAHIGELDPGTGEIVQHDMPDPDARDPHTLVFGPSGEIWFTLQGANMVGLFDPETRTTEQLIDVPTDRARPYGIKVDPSGRPWIVLLGTNKLATVDPETFELTEIPLPREDANPRRLGLTSDGAVWYVDYSQGYLGRYDPDTGAFREWRAPSAADSRPYGMAVDDRDRIWFVETGVDPNLFVGFDPATEEFFSVTPIGSGGGTVRHMYFDPDTRSVWFGTDTNYIGRARVP